MDKIALSTLPNLTDIQKTFLRKGNVSTISDLVLVPSQELAKRCRVSILEITQLVQDVCKRQASLSLDFQTLESVDDNEGKVFTLGDHVLNDTLGGGLRPGMIWEIVGQSAAGKTQFALQSSLYVQLPPGHGGLGGSACYLTTSTKLQTTRLVQIKQARGLLDASLEDVHTLSAPTAHILLNVLETQLPAFVETIAKTPSRKPVKLLVIDALAELFHLVEKVSTASLVERSQQLTQISFHLHRLAHHHQIAVLVLNEVVDVFDNYAIDSEKKDRGLLLYAEQARWFNRGHSVFGENMKEASLGLVWANQVNARVLLTRTARRRYTEEESDGTGGVKRQRRDEEEINNESTHMSEQEPALIRRLTVIFNSAASPSSCDYIVTTAGLRGLPSEEKSAQDRIHPVQPQTVETQPQSSPHPSISLPQVRAQGPTTSPLIQSQPQTQPQAPAASLTIIPSSQDEFDHLWEGDEFYETVDWDNLELTLRQSHQETD